MYYIIMFPTKDAITELNKKIDFLSNSLNEKLDETNNILRDKNNNNNYSKIGYLLVLFTGITAYYTYKHYHYSKKDDN